MSADYTFDDGQDPHRGKYPAKYVADLTVLTYMAEQILYWLDLNATFRTDEYLPASSLHQVAAPSDT